MEHAVDTRTTPHRAPRHTSDRAGPSGHAPTTELPSVGPGLALQQQAGNQAVQVLLRGTGVRPKLDVSQPGDPEEIEAEATAEQVMRSADPSPTSCSCADDDEPCDECSHKQASSGIHRSPSGPAPVSQLPESVRGALESPSQPLDSASRAFFEPRFNYDFSQVRVHTAEDAAASAHRLNAHAYTYGSSVVFAAGKHSPSSTSGRALMAHELTHVVQSVRGVRQSALGSRISRDPVVPAPAVDNSAVKAAVDIIVKALDGITTASDSAKILQQFQGKSPDFLRAIMRDLKTRGKDYDETPEGMVTWLFGDMTAADRRSLRALLMANHVLDDLGPILVKEIASVLSSILADGTPVLEILQALGGPDLDDLLLRLEGQTKKPAGDAAVYLFDNIDRVSASKLRTYFITRGGPRAWVYVAHYTAFKVANLIGGFLGIVSHSESTLVVDNFTDISVPALRQLTLQKLDERTRGSDSDSAENRLMKKLDQGDYEKLQQMPGLTLRKYDLKPTTLDKVASAAKWGLMIAEWTTCGMIGVATGLVVAAWDVLKGFGDILSVIKHLLGCLLYLVSGGSAGSAELLATKDFFSGLGKIFTDPKAVWNQIWGQLSAEFTTIEGPLADCKRAEFVVRKFIGVLVNVVLVFVAGAGIAKAAAEAAVGFAELAEEVGIVRALGQTAAKAGRAGLKFVQAIPGEVAEVLQTLRRPLEILAKVRSQLNTILLAVENEGVYAVLRERSAGLLADQKKFWIENRQRWKDLGTTGQSAQITAEEEAGLIQNAADAEQIPENKAAVSDVEAKAGQAEKQANDLQGEMKSDPDSATTDPQTTAKPGDFTPEQIEAANQHLEARIADPKNVRPARSKSGYDLEVDLGDGQTYKRRLDGTWCLSRNPEQCGLTVKPNVAQAADAAVAGFDLEDSIWVAIEVKERQSGRTFTDAEVAALRAQYRANPELILDVLEHEKVTGQVPEKAAADGNTNTGRGGSAPGESGKLGKDMSRARARKAGDTWICDEPKFQYPNPDGSTGVFSSDIGMTGPSEGGPFLIESKLGPDAGFTNNQTPGYKAVTGGTAFPANGESQRLARLLSPQWKAGDPMPKISVRIERWAWDKKLQDWFPTISYWK